MAFRAFTQTRVYEKPAASKEKGKSSIQCLECFDRNVYIGTKGGTVQHLILISNANGDLSPGQNNTRDGRAWKLGSSNPVIKLQAVPVFNHLLVLWDQSISVLNMFSLEPVPALKKIQHVSLFEVCNSFLMAQSGGDGVRMVTSSSHRKVIQIHLIKVDRWEVVKEVPLLQEPLALAIDGEILCMATISKYLLCDVKTGNSEELFPHNHSRRRVIVTSAGQGEFLLNGPDSLGMFVMKTGICQRPPLQWPREVLALGVCFPYILSLHSQVLSVYSMLDQKHKQTVSLSGARGLLSTSDGVLVFTETDIYSLRLVPLLEQIQTLVRHERLEEALVLLDGIQDHCPLDSHKELQKTITCMAGFIHFYQQGFSEARELLIKGELDPREIIHLYPDMRPCLSQDFQPQLDQVSKGRDLHVLWQEDRNTFHHYLGFLRDFLTAVRGTQQGLKHIKQVDCALLRLFVELGDSENLQQLVAFPNECDLEDCVMVLEQHNRFFELGFLLRSHGHDMDAIQTWVNIADGIHEDLSCSDPYGHIVWTLSQLKERDVLWKFADFILDKNQEKGVQIFISRPPDDQIETQEVLALLEKYPQTLLLYLEFLIHNLNSEEERPHTLLALTYVSQALQEEKEMGLRDTRKKLQQQLWESKFYDIFTVYESVKSTNLHTEKAILLARAGEHSQALQVLVDHEGDPQAAEAFCYRAAEGQDSQFKQTLLLTLFHIYLNSENLTSAAVDLLNSNPKDFAAEKVIQLLPDSWSVQLVSQFLTGSPREVLHLRRMVRLQKALSQVELMRHKVIQIQAIKTHFRLNKGQKCQVCQRELAEPQFSWSLHGHLMHTSCSGVPP